MERWTVRVKERQGYIEKMMRIRLLLFDFLGFRVEATWKWHAAPRPKASTRSAALEPKWQLIAHLRETLKPNTLSNSFISFLSRVLLPAPDGPVSTTGLGPAMAEGDTERRRLSEGSEWASESLADKPSEILWHESWKRENKKKGLRAQYMQWRSVSPTTVV